MSETAEYMLTPEQFRRVAEAGKPAPALVGVGGEPLPVETPEQAAGRVWRELGAEMGFDWTTVGPVPGKDYRFFMAVPLADALPLPPVEH